MLTLVAFLALPAVTLAQQGRGRDKDDVFVNGHDARDGRYDNSNQRRSDDRNRERRRDRNRNNNGYNNQNGDYNRRNNDDYNRRNNSGYGNYGGYGNNGGYGNYGYGNNGYGYDQSRQTALNAGYNEGVKEGRRDRQRGGGYDYRNSSAYRNASKDYNSRLGDRYTYQQYFRQGFDNGYRDGYNGY
jgi:hypothetical protein